MRTEIGEYIVGAYLKMMKQCDAVEYNVRSPILGIKGLQELDVVGFNFHLNSAYLCEVTTHLDGLLYKNNEFTINKIRKKYQAQQEYAKNQLKSFTETHYMFWSPIVRGRCKLELGKVEGLELIVNEKYTQCVNELIAKAKEHTKDFGNPFFRTLQILVHLRDKNTLADNFR